MAASSASTFHVAMLATPQIDYYAVHTQANWRSYCARHGYEFFCWREHIPADMHVHWAKVEHMRRHLKTMTADWLVFVDADTMVNRPELSLADLVAKHPYKEFLISEDCTRRFGIPVPLTLRGPLAARSWRPGNCGFMMIRNSEFGRQFFETWMADGRGPFADVADHWMREQLVLWLSLWRTHRKKIGVLGREVMRIGNNPLLDRMLPRFWRNAFVLHDKSLQVRGNLAAAPV